ncbi:MAG: hypothetical protein M1826_005057 [Phylliscum demangeonii]|nr:MAG: hypothetical protein M1826_005057 [Phylliscum demangeonii]
MEGSASVAASSDDQFVNIHAYQTDSSDTPFKLTTAISTGHTANIFSVKFMPHSGDRTLVTCAGDGDVRVFDVECSGSSTIPSELSYVGRRAGFNSRNRCVRYVSPSDTNARVYRSHSDRVKRIVTESSPNLFLTCSEDGEVRQWDLRQPSAAYPPPRGGKVFSRMPRPCQAENDDAPPPLISYARYHLDLNTISCSTSQPHYIALGGAHLYCFLHDRRMLGRDLLRERGIPSSSSPRDARQEERMNQATRCVRRFAPGGASRKKRGADGHITACKISDANPNEMIVSWSGDSIYSFDLIRPADVALDGERLGGGSAETSGVRVRNSQSRKRKRPKPDSSSSTEPRETGARQRQRSSGTVSGEDLALRVRYENGQSEEIPLGVPSGESSHSALYMDPLRVLNMTWGRVKVQDMARVFMLLCDEIFLRTTWREHVRETSWEDGTASWTATLGHAACLLQEMKETMRLWRYPVNPTEDEVIRERLRRLDREAAYRFVQAAGTIAKALGGTLLTAEHGESPLLSLFTHFTPAPNEQPPPRWTWFMYDFLKAIFSWLDGGRDGLRQAFLSSPTARGDRSRFPIPDVADYDAIEQFLVPYLLGLADGTAIPNVDATAFEIEAAHIVFESQVAAVQAFSQAIRTPFQVAQPAADEISANQRDEPPRGQGAQDREVALRFWGLKVARGLLMTGRRAINLESFGEVSAEEMERMWPPSSTVPGRDSDRAMPISSNPESRRDQPRANRPDETDSQARPADLSNTPPGGTLNKESLNDDPLAELADGEIRNEHNQELLNESDAGDGSEEDGERDESEEEEDEEDMDEDEDGLDDGDGDDPPLVWASAFRRSRMQDKVETNVPCGSHTRAYRGHGNVQTVKDVNFLGLQDEYVVSGSDCGNLFIWDKKTTRLVNILEGDGEVVNVVQGHPYEPMLAVSGIDHTIKIFSPDRRAQHDARKGNNIAQADDASAGSSTLNYDGRRRVDPRRPPRPVRPSNSAATTEGAEGSDEPRPERATDESDADDDGDEGDFGPATDHGLATRRRMQRSYEITSQNDVNREGGLSDARFTVGAALFFSIYPF